MVMWDPDIADENLVSMDKNTPDHQVIVVTLQQSCQVQIFEAPVTISSSQKVFFINFQVVGKI
jgi:hypothetical protein